MRGEKEEIEGELQGESLSLCRVGLHRVQLILPVNQTELAEKQKLINWVYTQQGKSQIMETDLKKYMEYFCS